jgi:transcriptional regulator with XRE-family HTH domain
MAQSKNPERQRWADLIRGLRGEKGLTQSQLGSLLDDRVSGQTVSLWEKGTLPTSENKRQIAAIKGWTLDQLESYLENGSVRSEREFDPMRILAELELVNDPRPIIQLIHGAVNRLEKISLEQGA